MKSDRRHLDNYINNYTINVKKIIYISQIPGAEIILSDLLSASYVSIILSFMLQETVCV